MNRQKQISNASAHYCITKPMVDAFKRGAKWADKTMIDKATKWLFENVYDYTSADDQEIVESFRRAMQE